MAPRRKKKRLMLVVRLTHVHQGQHHEHKGLEGDDQADKYHHGGPEQAVMLYSADHYSFWKQDLEIPDLPFGAFGENITVSVLNETNVHELDTYQIGDVLLQVTRLRQPCWKQERRLERPGLIKKIVNKGWSGWYHKVLVPGYIEAGMSVKLVDRVPNSVPLV